MNFQERLTITVNVSVPSPELDFNPSDYEYSMSVIGRIAVDDIISRDEKDFLIAYHNQEVRGVSGLEYIDDLDQYLVFMNIFANSNDMTNYSEITDSIRFEIWDASSGRTYVEVDIDGFQANMREQKKRGMKPNWNGQRPKLKPTWTRVTMEKTSALPLNR